MKPVLATAILGLTALSLATGQSGTANDFLVVPGVRVGPITAKTVRTDLKGLFPAATIDEQELELDEGMVFPATMVDKGNQSQSLAIVWTGKTADAHPKQVYLCRGRRRGECKWHTADISTGKTLLDLEAVNGGPFTIQGFGWGYGGSVISWDNGKLAKADCHSSISVAIDGARNRDGDLTMDLSEADRGTFTGNRPIESTTPALRKLNPVVTELLVIFSLDEKPCPR